MRLRSKSLRSQFVFPTVIGAIADANVRGRGCFQVVHYSVQADHLHLLVEAVDRRALIEGMRGFSASLTRRINRLLFRKGRALHG
jgi:putative transposase